MYYNIKPQIYQSIFDSLRNFRILAQYIDKITMQFTHRIYVNLMHLNMIHNIIYYFSKKSNSQ